MPTQNYENPFAQQDDELAALYDNARKNSEDNGVFVGGLKSGLYALNSGVDSTAAALARAVGLESLAKNRERAADKLNAEVEGAAYKTPAFADIHGPSGAFDWATGMLSSNIPLLAGMAGSAAAGGIGGARLLGKERLAQAAGKNAATRHIEALLAQGFEKQAAREAAKQVARKAEAEAMKRTATSLAVEQGLSDGNIGAIVGRHAGAVLPYATSTIGGTYDAIRNDPNASGTPEEHARAAILSGLGQSFVGTALEPLGIAEKILAAGKAARLAKKAGLPHHGLSPLQTFGLTTLGEGLTEGAENVIQQKTQQIYNPGLPFDYSQLAENALGGVVVGGSFAAPTAAYAHLSGRQDTGPEYTAAVLDAKLYNLEATTSAKDKERPEYKKVKADLEERRELAKGKEKAQSTKIKEAYRGLWDQIDRLEPTEENIPTFALLHKARAAMEQMHPEVITPEVIARKSAPELVMPGAKKRGGKEMPIPAPIEEEVARHPDLPALESELAAKGIDATGKLGAGHTAVVLDTDQGALRIAQGPLVQRPQSTNILQPVDAGQVGGLSYELTPKVDTSNITEEDVNTVEKALNAEGLQFTDKGVDNVGRLPDGRLVVTDHGAVTKNGKPGEPIPSSIDPTGTMTEAVNELRQPEAKISEYNYDQHVDETEAEHQDRIVSRFKEVQSKAQESMPWARDPAIMEELSKLHGIAQGLEEKTGRVSSAHTDEELNARLATIKSKFSDETATEADQREVIRLNLEIGKRANKPRANTVYEDGDPGWNPDDYGDMGTEQPVEDRAGVELDPNKTASWLAPSQSKGYRIEHGPDYISVKSDTGDTLTIPATLQALDVAAQGSIRFKGKEIPDSSIYKAIRDAADGKAAPETIDSLFRKAESLYHDNRERLPVDNGNKVPLLGEGSPEEGLIKFSDDYSIVPQENGQFLHVTHKRSKHSLTIPAHIEDFLPSSKSEKPPIYFDGQLISGTKIGADLAEAYAKGKQVPLEDIFREAIHAYEFRSVRRMVGKVDVTDTGAHMVLEEDDYRTNPILDGYGFMPVKVHIEASEGPAAMSRGVAKANRFMAAQTPPMFIVGTMDNKLFYGTKEQRAKYIEDANLEEKLEKDVNLLERSGTILKKESGAQEIISVGHIDRRHNTGKGNKENPHDGVIGIIRGAELAQGVSRRKVTDPDAPNGEGWFYEYDKGIVRSPAQSREMQIGADGEIVVDEKGNPVLGGIVKEEEESLNDELQFETKSRAPRAEPGNERIEFFKMFPPADQQGGIENYQGLFFSAQGALDYAIRDRQENLDKASGLSLLSGDGPERLELGVPPSQLETPEKALSKKTQFKADTTRAYVMSSSELLDGSQLTDEQVVALEKEFKEKYGGREYKRGISDCMLMPATFKEANDIFKKREGRGLRIGDIILLHRDPALPDATSKYPHVFVGIATLENRFGSHDKGIVVHPSSAGWKEAAGDFDGDSGVATYPDPLLRPLPKRTDDSGIRYLKEGDEKKEPVSKFLPEGAKVVGRSLLDQTISVPDERSDSEPEDLLSWLAARRATGFSQMVGMIVSQAQKLSEVGLLDAPVSVNKMDNKGNYTPIEWDEHDKPTKFEQVWTTYAILTAAITQGSISAKKKAAYAEQAMHAYRVLTQGTRNNKPARLDTLTGEPLFFEKDGKQVPLVDNYFTKWFGDIDRAPVDGSLRARQLRQLARDADRRAREAGTFKEWKQEVFELNPTKNGKGYRGKPVTKSEVMQVAAIQAKRTVQAHRNVLLRAALEKGKILKNRFVVEEATRLLRNQDEVVADERLRKLEAFTGIPRTTHIELAYRTLSLKRLFDEIDLFGGSGFHPEVRAAAERIIEQDGIRPHVKEYLQNAAEYSQYLGRQQSALDPILDEDRIKDIGEKRSELNNEIKYYYNIGYVTGPELVAWGPQSVAGRVTSIEDLRRIKDETRNAETVNENVRAKDQDNKELSPEHIVSGLYKFNRSTGRFDLVERADGVSVEPVSIEVARFESGANKAAYSKIDPLNPDNMSKILVGRDGLVTVRVTSEKASKSGTVRVEFQGAEHFEKVKQSASLPAVSFYGKLSPVKDQAKRTGGQFDGDMTIIAKHKVGDTFELAPRAGTYAGTGKESEWIKAVHDNGHLDISLSEGSTKYYVRIVKVTEKTLKSGNKIIPTVVLLGDNYDDAMMTLAKQPVAEHDSSFASRVKELIARAEDKPLKDILEHRMKDVAANEPLSNEYRRLAKNIAKFTSPQVETALKRLFGRVYASRELGKAEARAGETGEGTINRLRAEGRLPAEILDLGREFSTLAAYNNRLEERINKEAAEKKAAEEEAARAKKDAELEGRAAYERDKGRLAETIAQRKGVSLHRAEGVHKKLLERDLQAAGYERVPGSTVSWKPGDENKPRANTVLGGENPEPIPTNPDREALAKLSVSLKQKELQNATDSIGQLMGHPNAPTIVAAENMYDMLMAIGNEELAGKILAHAKNRKQGARGVHFVDDAGRHYIYVAGSKDTHNREQVAILSHELGHWLISREWSGLKQDNKDLAGLVYKDFKNWLGGKPETGDLFHEWLADNIASWLLQDKKVGKATDGWFKSMAKKFIKSFQDMWGILHNLLVPGVEADFKPSGMLKPLASVEAWMNSLAKSEEQIEYAFGPAPKGESIADRIEKRKARLAAWSATGDDFKLINDMVPYISQNLDTLLESKDAAMLRRIATEPVMRRRLFQLLGQESTAAHAVARDSDQAAAYLYVLASAGILRPSGPAQGIMAKLQHAVNLYNRQMLDALPDEADEVLKGLNLKQVYLPDGEDLIDPRSPAARLYKERKDRVTKGVTGAVQKAGQTYKNIFGWAIDAPYERVSRLQIPVLRDLVFKLQTAAWELGGLKPAGMVTRQAVQYQIYAQRFAAIMEGISEDNKANLTDILYQKPGVSAKNSVVSTAHEKIEQLLKTMFEYEKGSGIDVKERKNYWPFIPNHDYFMENRDVVLDIYSNEKFMHPEGWPRVLQDYKDWVEKELAINGEAYDIDPDTMEKGESALLRAAKAELQAMWDEDPKKFIDFYLSNDKERSLPGNALKRLGYGKIHTPSMRFSNPRELDFLLHSGNAKLHAQVMTTLNTDIGHVFNKYTKAAAKRAEHQYFLKSLGPEGLAGIFKRAREEQGATNKDIKLVTDYITAIQGLLGLEERDWIDNQIDKLDPDSWFRRYHSNKGGVMNDKLNAYNSFLLSWSNISHLTLSLAAASADPFGQLARHGDIKIFMQSFEETRKAMRNQAKKMTRSELEEFINLAGTLERMMSRQDMEDTYAISYMVPWASKLMSTFFKWNGVEFVTEFSRSMASFAAFHAIAAWAKQVEKGGEGGMRARQYLAELGLMPEDVHFSEQGNVKILNFDERTDSSPEEQERDVKVRAAIHTFVDQCTVRPDPTSRSLIASNPYFSGPLQWRGFIVTFNNNILKPAWARLAEEGNATPVLLMGLAMIPWMLMADMIRDAVKMAFSDDEDQDGDKQWRPSWKRGWSLEDHVLYAVKRAGFAGNHEIVASVIQPLMHGDVPKALAEAGGVAASDALKVSRWGVSQVPLPGLDLWGSWQFGKNEEDNTNDI